MLKNDKFEVMSRKVTLGKTESLIHWRPSFRGEEMKARILGIFGIKIELNLNFLTIIDTTSAVLEAQCQRDTGHCSGVEQSAISIFQINFFRLQVVSDLHRVHVYNWSAFEVHGIFQIESNEKTPQSNYTT